jgi:invasion protein IalB
MKDRGIVAVLPLRRVLSVIALAAIVIGFPPALAQQPTPKAQPKGQPTAQPKSQQTAAPATAEQPQQQAEPPQVVYSSWTKVCQMGPEPNPKRVCFTGKGGRLESGIPVVGAVLIEPEGEAKKILRVTLPLGTSLQPGTRIIIDQGQPMSGPYVMCVAGGCMADYEASDELIAKMRKGQSLNVQGISESGQPMSIPLPLDDFAKAYDAPPTDSKTVDEQHKQLQDELQKRAEEARKKLEGQQGAPKR